MSPAVLSSSALYAAGVPFFTPKVMNPTRRPQTNSSLVAPSTLTARRLFEAFASRPKIDSREAASSKNIP